MRLTKPLLRFTAAAIAGGGLLLGANAPASAIPPETTVTETTTAETTAPETTAPDTTIPDPTVPVSVDDCVPGTSPGIEPGDSAVAGSDVAAVTDAVTRDTAAPGPGRRPHGVVVCDNPPTVGGSGGTDAPREATGGGTASLPPTGTNGWSFVGFGAVLAGLGFVAIRLRRSVA
jgi:hypothetical protein